MPLRFDLAICVALVSPFAILPARAQERGATDCPVPGDQENAEASATKYLRLRYDEAEQPQSLETAIVRFVPTGPEHAGVTVDLIAAVHIGERDYYDELNRQFEKYDALLYELVAPEGTRVPKGGGRSRHVLSLLQDGMKNMLELESQLAHVDYERENFVHADMSPEEFARSMRARNENVFTIFTRMLRQSMAAQAKNPSRTSDVDLLRALFDKDRAWTLKRVMAEQFEDLETSMKAFEGPEGSTLIAERNKVALSVLAEQLELGKKRLGIFYGAGHMNGMERRLVAEFPFRRDSQRWLVAWDLRAPEPADAEP